MLKVFIAPATLAFLIGMPCIQTQDSQALTYRHIQVSEQDGRVTQISLAWDQWETDVNANVSKYKR